MGTKNPPLPPLDPRAPGRPENERYKEQFGIVIICADASEQAQIYEALRVLGGCKLKVVVT